MKDLVLSRLCSRRVCFAPSRQNFLNWSVNPEALAGGGQEAGRGSLTSLPPCPHPCAEIRFYAIFALSSLSPVLPHVIIFPSSSYPPVACWTGGVKWARPETMQRKGVLLPFLLIVLLMFIINYCRGFQPLQIREPWWGENQPHMLDLLFCVFLTFLILCGIQNVWLFELWRIRPEGEMMSRSFRRSMCIQ